MRSEIGKIALDTVFKERDNLNIAIVGKTFLLLKLLLAVAAAAAVVVVVNASV